MKVFYSNLIDDDNVESLVFRGEGEAFEFAEYYQGLYLGTVETTIDKKGNITNRVFYFNFTKKGGF